MLRSKQCQCSTTSTLGSPDKQTQNAGVQTLSLPSYGNSMIQYDTSMLMYIPNRNTHRGKSSFRSGGTSSETAEHIKRNDKSKSVKKVLEATCCNCNDVMVCQFDLGFMATVKRTKA